jgi:3',5'-cyclic AMP phosphodiesterase CpdA
MDSQQVRPMVRVVQISDTHLSPVKRHFGTNWAPVAEWIAGVRPDLVIHTGDVTVDGADEEEDLRYCAALLRGLGIPFLAVPGNHDVGDAGNPFQPVNAERLARWRRHFGDDRWVHDIEGWRLVGLDALLFGSGEPEEATQMAWLERTLAQADGRKIAWFLHRPLFLDTPGEPDAGYWSVQPAVRAQLMSLLRAHRVALVASGHVHRWHDNLHEGTRYVWGPSSGFLVGPELSAPMPGAVRLGAVVYEFNGPDVSVAFAKIDQLEDYWIDDVIQEVYPPRASA